MGPVDLGKLILSGLGGLPVATQPAPDELCRKRYQGRRLTYRQMAAEAVRLRKGDRAKGIKALPIREIAARLGYSQPKSIYELLRLGEKWGVEAAPGEPAKGAHPGQFVVPVDLAKFASDPAVAKWIEGMSRRGHSGRPLKTMGSLLRSFQAICQTTKSSPAQWLVGERDEMLEHARNQMDAFMVEYAAGRAAIKYAKGWTAEKADLDAVAFGYSKSVRNFLLTHGIHFPRAERSKLAASVIPFHGLFAEVRLTREEEATIRDAIKDKEGLDSDLFRWFAVGVEGLPRARALHGMRCEHEIVELPNAAQPTIWKLEARETKTEHFNQGRWPKYIYGDDTQASIQAVIDRGGDYVIEEREFSRARTKIYPRLRELFTLVGLHKKHWAKPDQPDSAYVLRHPSHALRHIGAQRWLELTNWNVQFVADMGWRSTQELSASYGRMPAEARFKLLGEIRFG